MISHWWLTVASPFPDITLQNASDLDFNLSGILNLVNLSASNSNAWTSSPPSRDMGLQNVSDLDSDFSRSLKVKSNCVNRLQ